MRYRHLKRTVIAVLATMAFVLLFGLVVRAILNAPPTRRMAINWLVQLSSKYGAELEIGNLDWGILPPSLRLSQVRFDAGGISAEVDALQVDLGRIGLTDRSLELGTVAARGVHLAISGLPESKGGGEGLVTIHVRHFELDELSFEGIDLPGGLALDLDGVRAGWTRADTVSRGFADIATAHVQVGKMAPFDTTVSARFALGEGVFEVANARFDGEGFNLRAQGHVADKAARLDVSGQLDVGWLDHLIGTHGLLAGSADVALTLDTTASSLLAADVEARHIEAAGFPLDMVTGRLELAGKSLRGTLERANFHGGTLSGRYELGEFGGAFPHEVHIQAKGISLVGFLDNIRVESAGLAATADATIDGSWNGRSIGAGHGHADVQFRGASPGLAVDGPLSVDLTGEKILLFDTKELVIGSSKARWQGALTLGTWEPAWSIVVEEAQLGEIVPLVNTWVGSTILPTNLEGSGNLDVNLSGPFSELLVTARIDAKPLRLPPIELDRLVANATIGGSELSIGTTYFEISEGFGEIEGGLAWSEAAGENQIDLTIRGNHIPLEAFASWIDLGPWIDRGALSFDGVLEGPIALPRGSWSVNLEDVSLGGVHLGSSATTISLADARFTCDDLRCDRGLKGSLWWDVGAGAVGGDLHWPAMSLEVFGDELTPLLGDRTDLELGFHIPAAGRPTYDLLATSDQARVEVHTEPDAMRAAIAIKDALEASATLVRADDSTLHGDGELFLSSAKGLLDHLAPDHGVPLTGTAHAAFTVDWGDDDLPSLAGHLQDIDLELQGEPIDLIEPAEFQISKKGFVVPGLRLRARDDELFARWAIDDEGGLRGNLSGTMDTLLLRFLLPDWEPAGRATGVVEILGTARQPLFEGIAQIDKGSFRLPGTRSILSQVKGTVLLSSGEVQLEGVDFRFMGGRARCYGRIRNTEDSLTLALNGTAQGLRFEVLPDLEARLSGTWQLVGPIEDLVLSGAIDVDRMNLTSKDDLATLLIGWLANSQGAADEGGLRLNLHVEAEETIDLRSPFVRLTGSANLDISGTSNAPGLVGQVEFLDGGEATLLGNRYEIERGSLSFSDPQSIDPFIDLQTSTWVQEYQISIHLTGTLDRFVSTAVSTPPLSSPEIYSLLGVGYRSQDLGSGAMGLGLASSILSSQLTSVLSRRAQLVLPVDQVRVDPFAADSTGNPTARLSVIKQITPAWTVILQSTLSGEREQIVVSRWYLAPGLFLEAAQHEDGSLSLDLKLRRPY